MDWHRNKIQWKDSHPDISQVSCVTRKFEKKKKNKPKEGYIPIFPVSCFVLCKNYSINI